MQINRRALELAFVALLLHGSAAGAIPLGRSFTYQGQLNDSGIAATGSFDFKFTMWDSPAGGSAVGLADTLENVAVTAGLFTVMLNDHEEFGDNAFTGDARWLEIAVRPGSGTGSDPYTTLSPRQALTATPFALKTLGIDGGGVPRGLREFTGAGVYAWIVPAGVTRLLVEVWGAGGGGGSGGQTNCATGGAGGGGGGYSRLILAVVPGTSYTIRIGAGGAPGGAAQSGAVGNPSSIEPTGGSIIISSAGGGGGGPGQATCQGSGGTGGVGGIGDPAASLRRTGWIGLTGIKGTGSCGTFGICSNGFGGAGGLPPNGTVQAAGAIGGIGGNGNAADGTPGQDGYALLQW